MKKKRVLSGQRPTGRLHLGHYHGTLKNWVGLQEKYDCFFFIADWHALTTRYDDVESLQDDMREMVIDWLAVGIDPERSVIYRQSSLPEVAELSLYLSLITPLAWLERCPTYKEQLREIEGREIATHGFVGYPVLQTADIVLPHGDLVPVGEDQLPHLELAREIVRRFNGLYGELFSEPKPLLSPVKKLLGTDGRKMSKSYHNAIYLSEDSGEVERKVRKMITDPQRVKLKDPGHPEICQVFEFHEIYSSQNLEDIEKKCREALRGCTECKDLLADRVNHSLEGYRGERERLEEKPNIVDKVLKDGLAQVRPVAEKTLSEVRRKMNIDWSRISDA